MIYFDHNATSPICSTAREAWLDACERFPANPSSPHRLGARAETALHEAREEAARFLTCSPHDIVWTAGATEANNAVLYHAARLHPQAEVWVSAVEHPSLLKSAERWFGERVRLLPVHNNGVIDLMFLQKQLTLSRPGLLAIMAANNETGVLQPWREIQQLCQMHGVAFACDAAQWVGKLPSAGLGKSDFVMGCAHKFSGPTGVGFIKVPPHFRPYLVGGEQEDGRRAGTENVAAILAMVAAWTDRERRIQANEIALRETWRDEFIHSALQSPGVAVLGIETGRLWNTIAILMPSNPDCRRRWVVQFDKLGFAVSTGSACASGKEKPSHVISAMGLDSSNDRLIRFSSGWETTQAEWIALGKALTQLASHHGNSRS